VSKGVRSNRGQAARLVTSPKTKAAAERASAIATSLRERGEWRITSASVYQAWTIEIDGDRYRVESVVSAFLEGPRGPCFVFNVTIRSARGTRPIRERISSTPWFQGVQARLGQNYANDDVRPERISLVRVLRGTTDPSTVLAELRHVAAAVEGRTQGRRQTKARSPRAEGSKQQRDDVWKIIDALGPTGWRVSSIAQDLEARVQHDGCRWHLSIGFIALVESAENRPGFVGTVNSWSTRGEREQRRNPIAKAGALLRKNGYRQLAETHYQHWHRGLGLRAANGEVELLGRAMRTIVGARTA
jgi:hypothetical protein